MGIIKNNNTDKKEPVFSSFNTFVSGNKQKIFSITLMRNSMKRRVNFTYVPTKSKLNRNVGINVNRENLYENNIKDIRKREGIEGSKKYTAKRKLTKKIAYCLIRSVERRKQEQKPIYS